MKNNEFCNIELFSSHLFWDLNKSNLDFEKSKAQIIFQVVEYGSQSVHIQGGEGGDFPLFNNFQIGRFLDGVVVNADFNIRKNGRIHILSEFLDKLGTHIFAKNGGIDDLFGRHLL